MEAQEPVTLVSLAEGAAVELFDRALEAALINIEDVNTPATAKRVITLKVEITPDEERSMGAVNVSIGTKFPSLDSRKTRFYMGKVAGRHLAVESNPQQMGLFGKQAQNVVQMVGVKPTETKES